MKPLALRHFEVTRLSEGECSACVAISLSHISDGGDCVEQSITLEVLAETSRAFYIGQIVTLKAVEGLCCDD